MAYIETKTDKNGKKFDVVHLQRRDIAIIPLRCPKCNSTLSLGGTDKWGSLKCRCRIGLLYPDAWVRIDDENKAVIDMITKERYINHIKGDKEIEKNN